METIIFNKMPNNQKRIYEITTDKPIKILIKNVELINTKSENISFTIKKKLTEDRAQKEKSYNIDPYQNNNNIAVLDENNNTVDFNSFFNEYLIRNEGKIEAIDVQLIIKPTITIAKNEKIIIDFDIL